MLLRKSEVLGLPGLAERTWLHPFEFPVLTELEDYPIKRRCPPPPGHPRQCQGLITGTLRQCDRWASFKKRHCNLCARAKPIARMYGEFAGKNLKELLVRVSGRPPAERMSVIHEVDMARAAATEAVKLFAAVMDHTGTKPIKASTRAQAINTLNQALKHVADLVKIQSSILHNMDGIITDEQLMWVTETIKSAVADIFGDHPGVATLSDAIDAIQPPSQGIAERAVRVSFS